MRWAEAGPLAAWGFDPGSEAGARQAFEQRRWTWKRRGMAPDSGHQQGTTAPAVKTSCRGMGEERRMRGCSLRSFLSFLRRFPRCAQRGGAARSQAPAAAASAPAPPRRSGSAPAGHGEAGDALGSRFLLNSHGAGGGTAAGLSRPVFEERPYLKKVEEAVPTRKLQAEV